MKRAVLIFAIISMFFTGLAAANQVPDFSAAGRNVHVYQWGSRYGGNDWAFVRTPDNYSSTGRQHELVVLNHGNGWAMDGSLAMANFSNKTQFGVDTQNDGAYLDVSRPDYVQFSSPLIEALLAQGFVVAGAQNDGQAYGVGSAGYGNNETTQNIADFVSHLQRNLNVTGYCHMIGASNGGLATLNAATIMPAGSIRSITLLYPLINLQYAWRVSHNTQVQQAYPGATADNFVNFSAVTRGHDPLSFMVARTNLVSSSSESSAAEDIVLSGALHKTTMFPWPRIYAIHSPDDTVTPSAEHWSRMRALMIRSKLKYQEKMVSGQHGSWQHFSDVAGIINWIKQ